jgi:glycosyltransferase involved in cell wall biosynthesis
MPRANQHRILFCEFCEDGTVGGSHQVLFDTIRFVDRSRFEPVVVFYQDNRFVVPLRELGVRVHVWERERRIEREPHESGRPIGKLLSALGAVRRRVRLLRDERIDLVHLNNTPGVGYDDWLPAALWLRLPCISVVMGSPYRFPSAPLRRVLTRRFDRLVAVSENVEQSLLRGGYPAPMLARVDNGIDIEGFVARVRIPAERMRQSLGVPPDRMLVVMVANLREWKGHSIVVAALARMAPELRKRLHVAFVGAARPEDEAYRRGLVEELERTGAADVVSWLGERTDVPDVLAAADVALHASTFPEPFGLVLIEALALGKPLVAARRGGPLEIVTPQTGILFDPDDPLELIEALERLLEQPELRRAMGNAARKRANRYTAQRMSHEMEALWEELIAARRPTDAAG